MKKTNFQKLRAALALLFVFSFLAIGGCDVEFGNSDDNNGGGGGGGSSEPEMVQGTITDIIPDMDTENIMVVITSDNNVEFTDTTNSAGFFSISSLSSTFAGTPTLEFFDTAMNQLAITGLDVFPTARVELGNITLENGTIIFADPTEVTFEGDVITNNCVTNSGSLEVEARREGVETDVIVQVSASTDVVRDGDEILCEEVLIGQTVEVRGELLQGNSVDSDFINLL